MEDYKLIDYINDNENTAALDFYKNFCDSTEAYIDNFNKNKLTGSELFENLKNLILNYNTKFKVRDKFNYNQYVIPKNFKDIIQKSIIQEEKESEFEIMIGNKKLENSVKFSPSSSNFEKKTSVETNEESEKIIKTYKRIIKPNIKVEEEIPKNHQKNYDLYYCTQQPNNNTHTNLIKKEYLKEFKLKTHLIQKLLKEIKEKNIDLNKNKILSEIKNLEIFEIKEIDLFDKFVKEEFYEIQTLQIDNTSLIIHQNNELSEDIKKIENEIKVYETKIKNIL